MSAEEILNLNFKKKKRAIKILGAGASGMMSAITLARNGFKVEIFEKRPKIGSFFEKDVHSLRNYCYNYDVIEKYKELGIKISNVYPIFKEFRFSPSLNQIEIYSKNKPLFYNFIRGYNDKRSFDVEFYRIAKKNGVKFYFNKVPKISEIDIVATGASSIKGIAYGAYYKNIQNEANSLYVFFDNRYSKKSYSYIAPFNKEASVIITSTQKQSKKEMKKKFGRLIKENLIVKNLLKGAKFKNEIFGHAFYDLPKTAIKNNKLYVGEAAGFLDAARGFGTHYAIFSGYLAAMAIIKEENYDKLWKRTFGKELKNQYFRRAKLEKLSNEKYEKNTKTIIKNYNNKISANAYKNLRLK